jgi:hypothetical protein
MRRVFRFSAAALWAAGAVAASAADCGEDKTITTTATIVDIQRVKTADHDRQLVVDTADTGCAVETIWLDTAGLPAECRVGSTVTATGKLDFGGFGDEQNLNELTALSCVPLAACEGGSSGAADTASGDCAALDGKICSNIAKDMVARIDNELPPETQQVDLERKDRELALKCKFVKLLQQFLVEMSADDAVLTSRCSGSLGDDVEAKMLALKLEGARKVIGSQQNKISPWVPQCP